MPDGKVSTQDLRRGRVTAYLRLTPTFMTYFSIAYVSPKPKNATLPSGLSVPSCADLYNEALSVSTLKSISTTC